MFKNELTIVIHHTQHQIISIEKTIQVNYAVTVWQ
jgi:hypothetical protein